MPRDPFKLTDHQANCLRLRGEGLNWGRVAHAVGCGIRSAQEAAKLGQAKLEARAKAEGTGEVVASLPELVVTAQRSEVPVEPLAEGESAFLSACGKLGIRSGMANALLDRLKRLDGAKIKIVDEIGDEELAGRYGQKIQLLLSYLDDFAMSRSSAKDLVGSIGTLTDKRQLLRGEPTQITRLEDVKKLDELGAMLKTEMKHRGKIIDITPEVV